MEKFDSPFGTVELTDERLSHILVFHPEVQSFRKYFPKTLHQPEIIRRSKYDSRVLILYHRILNKKYLAIVIRTKHRKFILTAYITSKIQHSNL